MFVCSRRPLNSVGFRREQSSCALKRSLVQLISGTDLLLILTTFIATLLLRLRRLGLLPPNPTRSPTTKRTRQRKVNVLLTVQSHNEARHIDNLLPHTDMSLLDEHTRVMDRLRETKLVHAGLQASLQEVFDAQGEDVIELHAGFVEDTDSHETADEGVAFEETFGIFFVEGEELSAISSVS